MSGEAQLPLYRDSVESPTSAISSTYGLSGAGEESTSFASWAAEELNIPAHAGTLSGRRNAALLVNRRELLPRRDQLSRGAFIGLTCLGGSLVSVGLRATGRRRGLAQPQAQDGRGWRRRRKRYGKDRGLTVKGHTSIGLNRHSRLAKHVLIGEDAPPGARRSPDWSPDAAGGRGPRSVGA
jgi:hypothetical protein